MTAELEGPVFIPKVAIGSRKAPKLSIRAERLSMLEVEKALNAYAVMMNTLDTSKLEPLLAENFHYAS